MVVSEGKNTQTAFQGKGNTVVLEADSSFGEKVKTVVLEEKKTQS